MNTRFSIIITTKNRLEDLIFTLKKVDDLLLRDDVECIICDDGSTDGTFEYIKDNFPEIIIFRNEVSKGLIYSRNILMKKASGEYAISIDDDLHFVTENPLETIDNYFINNPTCGVVSFRIYWNRNEPKSTSTDQKAIRIRSFAGGANAWKLKIWNQIPNYPEWFQFYGEEDFAAYNLFKKNFEAHYLPQILVNHRVDLLNRKKNTDYQLRQRRSFRSGWYLYMLFFPKRLILRRMVYTFWIQIRNKTFKGDFKATLGIFQAVGDVLLNFPKLLKNSNRLSYIEFNDFEKLKPTILYWKPEDEK